MGDKKQLFISIFGSLAVLLFLVTRFYMPISKDNVKLLSRYKKLRLELKAINSVGKNELDYFEQKTDAAISGLEKKFPSGGKADFIKQLTQVPAGSNIVFTNIAHREPYSGDGFQAYSVDVTMRAPFYDLIKYLAEIEGGPSAIFVDGLTLVKADEQAQFLDVKAAFLGFQLNYAPSSLDDYMQEEYKIFNKKSLEKLLEPVKLPDSRSVVVKLKGHNPFVFDYSSEKLLVENENQDSRERAAINNLSLQGILRIGNEMAAMINNNVVRKGDRISDMEVSDIGQNKVILKRLGREYILKMGVDDGILQK